MSVNEQISLLYNLRGKALRDRDETTAVLGALMGPTANEQRPRPPLSNVYGPGPLLLSDIPASCRSGRIVLGIDEAGRGSVNGPMTYGMAFWNAEHIDPKHLKDFNDSKQLSHETRCRLLDKVILPVTDIGFGLRVLHASEISRNMLRPSPYNLNQMSHDTAMELIQALVDAGVKIDSCFIDTVGIAHHYQRKLEQRFPTMRFTVESKADANYAPCAAASVVAKVVRDRVMEHWAYSEDLLQVTEHPLGSGYPSDPTTKAWMAANRHCPVFGYPDLVRFSWNPTKKALDPSEDVVQVIFAADLEEEDEQGEYSLSLKRQSEQMSVFLGAKKKAKRYPYFQRNKLERVTKLF
jgi:ribonuclease H2 subunit A